MMCMHVSGAEAGIHRRLMRVLQQSAVADFCCTLLLTAFLHIHPRCPTGLAARLSSFQGLEAAAEGSISLQQTR